MNHYKSVLPKVIEDKDCERELDNMYGCINKALKKADPKSKATIVDRNMVVEYEVKTTKKQSM